MESTFYDFCKYCITPASMEVKISYIRSQFKIWAQGPFGNFEGTVNEKNCHPVTTTLSNKSEDHKYTSLFDMWLGCDVWSLPVHLRRWLLVEGICLAPQLHDETLWCIDNKPVWNTSSPPKPQKKRKVLHSDKETISLEEAKGLLQNLQSVFALMTKNASQLRLLPVQLKKRASIAQQMEKFWEPTLSKCFGSPELFLFFFVHSEKGSAALTKLVEDGDVTKEVALAMKHAAVDAVREWRDKVQVLQNKKLVLAINSTHISRSGYESLASSLRLESKDSPTCVSIQHLHDLPLALQLEELPGIVAATVHKRFETGWNVTWTTDEWIESMISSDCVRTLSLSLFLSLYLSLFLSLFLSFSLFLSLFLSLSLSFSLSLSLSLLFSLFLSLSLFSFSLSLLFSLFLSLFLFLSLSLFLFFFLSLFSSFSFSLSFFFSFFLSPSFSLFLLFFSSFLCFVLFLFSFFFSLSLSLSLSLLFFVFLSLFLYFVLFSSTSFLCSYAFFVSP
ncbi:DLAT [Balamuthia mandrillaris]